MRVYQTRLGDGAFVEVVAADESPLEPGVFHVPAGCVTEEPPTFGDGEMARWTGSAWEVVPYAAPEDPEVPETTFDMRPISDRQFAQQLALLGTISEAEALGWAARGDLPDAMEAAIAALPEGDRFAARMLLSSATTYERAHPLVPVLGALLGYDAAAIDELWRAAAQL